MESARDAEATSATESAGADTVDRPGHAGPARSMQHEIVRAASDPVELGALLLSHPDRDALIAEATALLGSEAVGRALSVAPTRRTATGGALPSNGGTPMRVEDAMEAARGGHVTASPAAKTSAVDESTPWTPLVVTVRQSDGHIKVWRGVTDAVGPLRIVGVRHDDGTWDWGDAGDYGDFRLYKAKQSDKYRTVDQYVGKNAHSVVISIGFDGELADGSGFEASSLAPAEAGAKPKAHDRPGVSGGEQGGTGDEPRRATDQPWADKKVRLPNKHGNEDRPGPEEGIEADRGGGESRNEVGRTKDAPDRPHDKRDGGTRVSGGGKTKETDHDRRDRQWEAVDPNRRGDNYKDRDDAKAGGVPGGDAKHDARGVPQGSDLLKLLEFPRDVAIALTLGLILADADITGLGDTILKKALKGATRDALSKELRTAVKKYAKEETAKLREVYEQLPEWGKLSRAERADILRQNREAIEEAAYLRVREQVADEAHKFETWAEASARDAARHPDDAMINEIARDDAVNAARASEARAAIDELAPVEPARTSPYDPKQARKDMENKYPGDVESSTVPRENDKNAGKANQRHRETGVVFDRRSYPVFDDVAAFDTRLPDSVTKVRDRKAHMREATRQLRAAIESGQVAPGKFSEKALSDIRRGNPQIDGWRWHHHQERGRMQLVPAEIHDDTGHVGGFDVWYGDGE